tara:strand:+ start:301 stop:771 length:471 start_codon:yes stop_codon:yes gene_type:complete
MQDIYDKITGPQSYLSSTFKALFTNPGVGLGIARLQETIDALDLEPWVTYTVGLTVAHEREDKGLWDAILPLAQDAGVSDPVIDGLGKGTGPRGLLPKDGIWIQFTLDVLRGSMKDSIWQATTHLVGDEGAVALAFTACYFDMITRLNKTFGLDVS